MKFNNLAELKQHLLPALEVKVDELKYNGITNINIDDIWNFLSEEKWKRANDLNLSEMVNDILKFDNRK